MQTKLSSTLVDLLQSPWLNLQKLDELGCRTAQKRRRGFEVEATSDHRVECLGEQCRKVVVA